MHTSRGLPMSAFRRGTIVVVALVIALTVGGCTDEPTEPDPTSSPSTTTSATPDPTPTTVAAPVRPEAMSTASVEGAIAAATYFAALYQFAYQSQETAKFSDLAADDCEFCQNTLKDIAEIASRGNTTDGADIRVIDTTGTETDPGHWYTATLRAEQAGSTELDPMGTAVSTSPGGEFEMFFVLDWADGWTVRAVDVKRLGVK